MTRRGPARQVELKRGRRVDPACVRVHWYTMSKQSGDEYPASWLLGCARAPIGRACISLIFSSTLAVFVSKPQARVAHAASVHRYTGIFNALRATYQVELNSEHTPVCGPRYWGDAHAMHSLSRHLREGRGTDRRDTWLCPHSAPACPYTHPHQGPSQHDCVLIVYQCTRTHTLILHLCEGQGSALR